MAYQKGLGIIKINALGIQWPQIASIIERFLPSLLRNVILEIQKEIRVAAKMENVIITGDFSCPHSEWTNAMQILEMTKADYS